MPSPFPGMNPYLEHPAFRSSFHTRLMVAIADAIESQLSSHYYVKEADQRWVDELLAPIRGV